MSKHNLNLGKQGEESALSLLRSRGYKILARNYRTKIGEIDIIASDKGTLCFIEVKTRNSERFGSPLEALSSFKQRQISKAALLYLKEKKLFDKKARFDVVSILNSEGAPKSDLIKNAFELDRSFTY